MIRNGDTANSSGVAVRSATFGVRANGILLAGDRLLRST